MCWDLSLGEMKLTIWSGMTPLIPNLYETICVKPLPEFARVNGDPGVYTERLRKYVDSKGIRLEYSDAIGSAGCNLLRQAVPALLNACDPDVVYVAFFIHSTSIDKIATKGLH